MSTKKQSELESAASEAAVQTARTAAARAKRTPAKKAAASSTEPKSTAALKAVANTEKPKKTVKKAPAKKASAKVTDAGSHQSVEQVEAAVKVDAIEAKDGAEVTQAIDELAKKTTKKKAAAKKAAVKKAPAKKSVAKAKKVDDSDQTAAQIAAGEAVAAAEAKDGARVSEAIDAMATAAQTARAELAAKSAAENNTQTNLSARSAKDSKIAAKGFKKPRRRAKKKAVKAAAAAAPVEIFFVGIEKVEGVPYEQTVAEAEKAAAQAARAQLAAKSAAENNTQTNLSARSKASVAEILEEDAHQSEKQIEQGVKRIQIEAEKGAQVYRDIEEVKDTPYSNPDEIPGMAARKELAAKSAAENNAQANLSARSIKDAKIAAKGFKKPCRRKKAAAQTKAQETAAIEKIAAEAEAGARVYRGIEAVEGTPYETVVENVKKAVATKARTALASKNRTVKGSKPKENSVSDQEKTGFYAGLDDQTLCEMAQAVGLDMDLETIKNELTVAADIEKTIESYVDEAKKAGKDYSFDVDGFDISVIPYLCTRIADALPNKAQDNAQLAKKIEKDVDRMLINDSFNDTAIYNDLMDDVRAVLMYGQQHGIELLDEMEKIIPTDLHKLLDRFMTVAYTILPGWQYKDVTYYQGFLYGVLSQFADLTSLHNRAMMDIADLYILHGDYNRGNADYGYVLRENDLKDQIYYRYANIYRGFDIQRARSIAQDALNIIDGRYEYYPKIIEILQN